MPLFNPAIGSLSAGTTKATGSEVVFSNSNGISFGADGRTITGSHNALTSQSNQALSASNGSFTFQTAQFSDANGVSFGTSAGSAIFASVAAQSIQPVAFSADNGSVLFSTLSFSNLNGVSFATAPGPAIQGSVLAQSAQSIGLYASSNTYLTSSGTADARSLSFRGDKSITIGISNSEVLFSVGAYLTTAMASNRGTDFVQATAAFNGTNASGTIASGAISVSVADAVGQSNQSIGLYASSNTYLTSSGTADARSLSFRGDKSITVGISASEVLFSVGAYITTADLSANSSNYARNWKLTSNTAGTTSSAIGTDLWLAGGQGITLSGSSNSITFSVGTYITTGALSGDTTKYVQNWKLTSNTAGTTSSAQGTDLWLAGGQGITLSGSSNTITFSVGSYITTGALSQDSSKYAQNWKLTSNTAGTTSSAFGSDLWLAGGQGITLSGSSNSITFSVGSYITTGALSTGNIYASSNTYLTSSGTYDLRSLSFRGDKSITIGISASEVLFSVGAYLTTAMASGRGTDFVQATAAFAGTNASGTIASDGISVSVDPPGGAGTMSLYASSNTYLTSSGTIGANKLTFRGDKSITVGISASEVLFSVGAYLTTAALSTGNIYASSNTYLTSSGTYDLRSLSFRGDKSITVGISASEVLFSVGAYLTTAALSTGNIYASSNTYLTSSGTYDLRSLSFRGDKSITVGISASEVLFSVGAYLTTAALSTMGLYASSNTYLTSSGTHDARSLSFRGDKSITVGISGSEVLFSVGAYITTGALSTGNIYASSNTYLTSSGTYDLRSLSFRGDKSITVGISASEVLFSVGAYITTGALSTGNIYASSNTYLTSSGTYDLRSLSFRGDKSITVGISASEVLFSVGAYLTTGALSTGNIYASSNTYLTSSGSYNQQSLSFRGDQNITVGISASEVVFSAPSPVTVSMWPPALPHQELVSTYYSGSTSSGPTLNSTKSGYTFSLYVVPLPLPCAVAFSQIRMGISNNTAVGTGSITHFWSAGFYTKTGNTLSLMNDFYGGLLLSQNSQTSQTFSVVTFTTGKNQGGGSGGFAGIDVSTIFSRAVANMSSNSEIYGRLQWARADSGVGTTLTGGQYWFVFANCSVSLGANVLSNVGWLQSDALQSDGVPDLGRENQIQTSNYLPGWGAISTTFTSQSSAATFFPLPNSIARSDMSYSSSAWLRFHFPIMRNLT